MTDDFADKLKQIEVEKQREWEKSGLHEAEMDEDKEKCYVVDMFPYPSGKLHMGHGRAFSLSDVYARYKSMQGYNVMHPMGWDAFGMPAENAAIDRDTDPESWTMDCIYNMRGEFKRLGFSLDWSREITTCTPDYYKWDQWIFNKMIEEGIAYRAESTVNWCPECETVLADEQVEDGLCWRCDSVVEDKSMKQWKLGITEYSEQLLDDLDKLDGWPQKVRKMQSDWIGKSTGAKIDFPVKDGDKLEVFTTRPDTIFGATFMALAPEHELAEEVAENKQDVRDYIEEAKRKDSAEREEKSKAGVFTGRYAENPFTGEEIPIYVAEFVLEGYGSGAIMAVPAHDQRDFEFAKEHGIDIKEVVEPEQDHDIEEEAYEGDGEHINSEFLDGLDKEDAVEKAIERLEDKDIGEADVNYKLRDWLISRQRYWGTPIPVVYCDECGAVPVPEEDLPVELPEDVEFTGEGNPIESSEHFKHTECPECGKEAERETDTMDTFFNSSWYFLRYCSPDFEDAPFDEEEADYWMNVDQYVGGIEHAVMHLLYARFFQKFLNDQGMVSDDEPFDQLLTQGMVNHPAYKCPEHGWMYPEQIEDGDICSKCGREVEVDTMKMSKSKNNVVRPAELVEEHGADTARLFILRASHPTKELDWSKDGVEASEEMLERVHRLVVQNKDLLVEAEVNSSLDDLDDRIVGTNIQRTVEEIEEHFESYEFNIAATKLDHLLTKLFWYVEKDPEPEVFSEGVRKLVKMLSPFSPHITEEIWQKHLGNESFLIEADWPEINQELLDEDAEKIDKYFETVSSDIRQVENILDSEPETIKVIQSEKWKYDAFNSITEVIDEAKDVGRIMGEVLDGEMKKHADKIKDFAIDALENPGKFRKQYLDREIESEALEANRKRWAEEFDAEIIVEKEAGSEEKKASRAEPGRPAIVIE